MCSVKIFFQAIFCQATFLSYHTNLIIGFLEILTSLSDKPCNIMTLSTKLNEQHNCKLLKKKKKISLRKYHLLTQTL